MKYLLLIIWCIIIALFAETPFIVQNNLQYITGYIAGTIGLVILLNGK